jgi:hypothetical protein
MPIAILILTLVAYGYALLSFPEFRRWGLAGGAVAALALGLYFALGSSEATRATQRIAASQLVIDQLALTRTVRGATLTGRVQNGSPDARLRELTLTLRLRDCPKADTPVPDCPVIGESQAIARPDAPPGQIRALSAHFLFSDLPAVTGTLRWDWAIAGIRATD